MSATAPSAPAAVRPPCTGRRHGEGGIRAAVAAAARPRLPALLGGPRGVDRRHPRHRGRAARARLPAERKPVADGAHHGRRGPALPHARALLRGAVRPARPPSRHGRRRRRRGADHRVGAHRLVAGNPDGGARPRRRVPHAGGVRLLRRRGVRGAPGDRRARPHRAGELRRVGGRVAPRPRRPDARGGAAGVRPPRRRCSAVDALSFALSAACVAASAPGCRRAAGSVPPLRPRVLLTEVAEGLRFLWRHAGVRSQTVIGFLLSLSGAGFMSLSVPYADRLLGVGTSGWRFGLVFAAWGVGGILVAVLTPRLLRWSLPTGSHCCGCRSRACRASSSSRRRPGRWRWR